MSQLSVQHEPKVDGKLACADEAIAWRGTDGLNELARVCLSRKVFICVSGRGAGIKTGEEKGGKEEQGSTYFLFSESPGKTTFSQACSDRVATESGFREL